MNTNPILLVEDNPDDELLALEALKANKVVNAVVVARDGKEAVDYLFSPGNALPAFILLDLKLPKVSGLEVLQRVREDDRTKLVPVLIFTSSMSEPDLQASCSLGGNIYICKLVDFDVFSATIGRLARGWLEDNMPAASERQLSS